MKITRREWTFQAAATVCSSSRSAFMDPYGIDNLAGSSQPEHQRLKKEMRTALFRRMDETNDQGRIPQSQAAIDFWVRDAEKRWGMQEWRR